jgi:hypothetical protein
MEVARNVALTVLIIGGLNWAAIALFNVDLVQLIFGGNTVYQASIWSRIVYTLVGASALYALTFFRTAEERHSRVDNR